MYWYKVKTLLIALFAAINIFLIVFIVHGKIQQEVYEKNEMKSLLYVLENNNIEVEEGILPEGNKMVRTAMVENLMPSGKDLAKSLLGDGFAAVHEDGQSEKYTLDSKMLIVDGGKFYYADTSLGADIPSGKESVDLARNALNNYGIDTSFANGEISGDLIVFVYNFDELPLFEHTLNVKMAGDKVAEMGGYIIGIKESGDKRTGVASPKEALTLFLRDENRGEEKQKIVSVSLGYSVLLADSTVHFKNTETIPTYKITTDKNNIYYYDAR